jgi:membrane-bound lytic murein transglycosylase F
MSRGRFAVTIGATALVAMFAEACGREAQESQAGNQQIGHVRVVVSRTPEQSLALLNRGEGDLIAARLYRTDDWCRKVACTHALHTTPMVIVQRDESPKEVEAPRAVEREINPDSAPPGVKPDAPQVPKSTKPSLDETGDLGGRAVHVRAQTAAENRLATIDDSLTADIQIVRVSPEVTDETLVRKVAQGGIDLTPSPKNVAELSLAYYDHLSLKPTILPDAELVWAARRNSPLLLQTLNTWIERDRAGKVFQQLYYKYFQDMRGYQARVESRYLTSQTGQLSQYDDAFKRHAQTLGWDWRLLASQSYQESRFNPSAKSWAGARGLLQLMPRTARLLGVRNSDDPEQNIAGGVKFLRDLDRHWTPKIPDPAERLRFILAAYNTGSGHVEDAQRLAEKHGGNPQSWKDVSYWLLQKSKKEVYNDPVVKHGFSRGLEPVTYVDRVLDRFEHYKQFVRA